MSAQASVVEHVPGADLTPVALDGRRILVIAYGHVADTMAAIPALRSLRKAYPSATVEVLALEAAAPILGPCPYLDRLLTWSDFQHKGSRLAKAEKLAVISALALRMRRRRYDATIVLHRSSGAIRRLAAMIGTPVLAGVTDGSAAYTHAAPAGSGVESSRDENRRVLCAIGVNEDGGGLEIWSSRTDSEWAQQFLAGRRKPIVGLHPGSDWSCQQWLPERFAAVARELREHTGATIVVTGSQTERELEAEIVDGAGPEVVQACGITTFGQFVEVVRRLDVLVSVNSAAAAVARATGTPAVVLLGLEDARYTGLVNSSRQTVIQPGGPAHQGGWCEFGRWGVLSGCQSPMCRGLGGLERVLPATVTAAAMRRLGSPATSRDTTGG